MNDLTQFISVLNAVCTKMSQKIFPIGFGRRIHVRSDTDFGRLIVILEKLKRPVLMNFGQVKVHFIPWKKIKGNFKHIYIICAAIFFCCYAACCFIGFLTTRGQGFLCLFILAVRLFFNEIRSKNSILSARMSKNTNANASHKGKQYKSNDWYTGNRIHYVKIGQFNHFSKQITFTTLQRKT